mgnify:CR=1 FL=1
MKTKKIMSVLLAIVFAFGVLGSFAAAEDEKAVLQFFLKSNTDTKKVQLIYFYIKYK